jgi:hypothetical protein
VKVELSVDVVHNILQGATKSNQCMIMGTLAEHAWVTVKWLVAVSSISIAYIEPSRIIFGVTASVDATRGAGLANLYGGQHGYRWLQVLPNPLRYVFTGWVFQSWNVI